MLQSSQLLPNGSRTSRWATVPTDGGLTNSFAAGKLSTTTRTLAIRGIVGAVWVPRNGQYLSYLPYVWFSNLLTWIKLSLQGVFAFVAAHLVKTLAKYAAGSGISEIKCILAGFVMKGYLGFGTFIIKSLTLVRLVSRFLSIHHLPILAFSNRIWPFCWKGRPVGSYGMLHRQCSCRFIHSIRSKSW